MQVPVHGAVGSVPASGGDVPPVPAAAPPEAGVKP